MLWYYIKFGAFTFFRVSFIMGLTFTIPQLLDSTFAEGFYSPSTCLFLTILSVVYYILDILRDWVNIYIKLIKDRVNDPIKPFGNTFRYYYPNGRKISKAYNTYEEAHNAWVAEKEV